MNNNINNLFNNYTPYINGWEKYKRAAVTIPLINFNNSLHILFEVRAKTLRSQPNEICFPGGKIEGDETPLETALRETTEEIGISNEKMTVISPLDLFVSPFNIIIHPYLISISDISEICINSSEVEKIFYVPLKHLLSQEPQCFTNLINLSLQEEFPYDLIPHNKDYKFATGFYEIPFYTYNEHVIWGLTAKILLNFISILKSKNYLN